MLIVGLNLAAENILGISARRAYGESLQRLVDDEPELRDILSRALATGDQYAMELRLGPTEVHADERIVDCHVSLIVSQEASLLIEMTDVTRRARISRENTLLIQYGAGRQMIRRLAHEIKNPSGAFGGPRSYSSGSLSMTNSRNTRKSSSARPIVLPGLSIRCWARADHRTNSL